MAKLKLLEKWDWYDEVTIDTELSGAALRVAFRLASNIRDERCIAYPSVKTLAAECGICERAVQKALRQLHARGHITQIAEGGGRIRTTKWELGSTSRPLKRSSENRTESSSFSTETVNGRSQNPERAFAKPRTGVRKTPNGRSPDTLVSVRGLYESDESVSR